MIDCFARQWSWCRENLDASEPVRWKMIEKHLGNPISGALELNYFFINYLGDITHGQDNWY